MKVPADCAIQCPWCDEVSAAERWLKQLPPIATIVYPQGGETGLALPPDVSGMDERLQGTQGQSPLGCDLAGPEAASPGAFCQGSGEQEAAVTNGADRSSRRLAADSSNLTLDDLSATSLRQDELVEKVHQELESLRHDGPPKDGPSWTTPSGDQSDATFESSPSHDAIAGDTAAGDTADGDIILNDTADSTSVSFAEPIAITKTPAEHSQEDLVADPAPSETRRPTLEEIEEAWAESESYSKADDEDGDGEDVIEGDAFGSSDDDFDATVSDEDPSFDDELEQLALRDRHQATPFTFDEDDRPYYRQNGWGKRRQSAIRFFKIAAPSLMALPILAYILILAKVDLGFYPFDGSSHSAMVQGNASSSDADDLPVATSANDDSTGASASDHDSDMEAADTGKTKDDEVDSPAPMLTTLSDTRDNVSGATNEDVGDGWIASDKQATSINTDQFQPTNDSVVAVLPSSSWAASSIDTDNTIAGVTDNDDGSIVELIQSIKTDVEPVDDLDGQPRRTIEMIAREQALQRHKRLHQPTSPDRIESDASVAADQSDLASESHSPSPELVIDDAVPPITSELTNPVRQASAEATVGMSFPPSEALPLPERADPIEPAEVDTQTTEATAPDELETSERAHGVSEGGTSEGSTSEGSGAEVVSVSGEAALLACQQVVRQLEAIGADHLSDREATMATVKAYRNVSRLADFVDEADTPKLDAVFEALADEGTLSELESLCAAWIDWPKRQTKGILLIGTLTTNGNSRAFVLGDKTRLSIVGETSLEINDDERCIALAEIVSGESPASVRLIRVDAVP
ncbi:hypothetical protein [Roseiconus lacunae]|uniref:Uncharacterized protein n=1 Tax=Roseiconus lacunae TaxID=2605694 RepID=A0ABT7PKT9_9BACT|nr:hypothetical protein [Roseiconus lacunae]MDM4017109.1 hypothetical protein [Roseiconus lacunae]